MWHTLMMLTAEQIALVTIVLASLIAIIAMYPDWIEYFQKKHINKVFGAESYTEDEIKNAVRFYIEPDCSQMDPAGESEIRQAVLLRDELYKNVNKFVENEINDKHLLVLADSGMGKTAFTLQYYWQNHRSRWNKKKRIAIIPLGRKNAIESIIKIDRQNETILILDAFDEDIEAISDHKARLSQLMDASQNFKRVIVTSRTQFFGSDEEIPKETGVAIVTPRVTGGRIHKFYKLYLAPFSDYQVELYIKKRFRFWQFSERERAKELVKRVPELIVRPMLLAQIPDLISDPKISVNSLAEFYGYMAEKWFDREESWVPTKVLQNFSERLAVDIYLNRDIRFMERISPSELKQLIVLSMPGIDHWKLTTRSLINRDAEGNYKFSHRSFMEYFFVLAYFKGEKSCLTVKWTDMMITLFESAMNAQLPIVEATSVNIDDFSKTGMFANKPWLWREPSIISLDICVESISNVLETRHNLETHISSANKNLKIWSLKELSLDGLSIFADLGVDLIWYVDRDARNLDPDLTSLTEDPIWKKKSYVTALNNKKFAGASDWRSPTIDEFEWIVIANQSILSNTGTGYLYNEVPYLCSDVTQNQKHIVVSFGNSPISNLSKQLTFLGSRHWKTTTHKVLNIGLHIYEVEDQLQHLKREYQESWLTVLVSHHGALNLFT